MELSGLQLLLQKEEDRLRFVQQRLSEEEEKCIRLEKELRKERKDYERLTHLSIQSLFYTLLQSAEKQKGKELQEYLAAELKWQQSRDAITRLQEDGQQLDHHIRQLQEDTADYPAIFKQKEQLLLEDKDGKALSLIRQSEQITSLKNQSREIQEALELGVLLEKKLNSVIDYLQSASGWGTWDMLGGGLISTAIKRGYMDDAREAASEAQHLLHSFNKELGDIKKSVDQQLNMNGFTGFADYFFDGLIVDWMVKKSINDSHETTLNLLKNVRSIIQELTLNASLKKEEVKNAEKVYVQIVETC